MNTLVYLLGIVFHLDTYLRTMAADYGIWVYAILFVVIFCETGLVVTPFLPGDSLLFMLGTLSAAGLFGVLPSLAVLVAAAILGDTANYHIGRSVGPKAFSRDEARFFKKDNLVAAEAFYVKWGGVAIILGRFMPIIRTFVPFAAGIARMRYPRFLSFNVIGAILWVSSITLCGYFFGNVPFVRRNLTPIIYGIILLSLIPAVVGFFHGRLKPTSGNQG